MQARSGPFYVGQLARALARQAGLATVDEHEALQIEVDIFQWYARDDFDHGEVLVTIADDPRSPRPLREADVGDEWRHLYIWHTAIMLTEAGARRYLAGCGLLGAKRVLKEWFGQENSCGPVRPSNTELGAWMLEHVKTGSKRDQTIKDCCTETGATWRQAVAAWKRYREELDLRQGQKTVVPQSGN